MSSNTRLHITCRRNQALDLQEVFGEKGRQFLQQTLSDLPTILDKIDLAKTPDAFLQLLKWEPCEKPNTYKLQLSYRQLPPQMQQMQVDSLQISLRIGLQTAHIKHSFQFSAYEDERHYQSVVAEQTQKLANKAINQLFSIGMAFYLRNQFNNFLGNSLQCSHLETAVVSEQKSESTDKLKRSNTIDSRTWSQYHVQTRAHVYR